MEEIITVNGKNVSVKEFRGKRVVTLKEIDIVHERPEGTARRNFNTNRKHLIANEDYFVRNSSEAKSEYGITAPNGLILISEQGYLMLAKSFTDDLAWDVQRQLVHNYFNPELVHTVTYQYPISPATMDSATNAGRLFERIMKNEGSAPHEVAMVVKNLFYQAGIDVLEQAVKIPAYEQLSFDIVTRS